MRGGRGPKVFLIPFVISLWTLLIFVAVLSAAGLAEAMVTGVRTGDFRKAYRL